MGREKNVLGMILVNLKTVWEVERASEGKLTAGKGQVVRRHSITIF